jgi:decaprenyl-phosphate phosphoribosyltransferase
MSSSVTAVALERPSTVAALARGLRPRQWIKNLLVFAAPAAAGSLDDPTRFVHITIVFAGLCAVSSALYLFNDVRDADADRAHPVKQNRPVASGALHVNTAVFAGIVLMAGGVGVVAAVRLTAAGLVLAYVVTALSYSFGLKHVAVIELFAVAAGFVLRAGIGAAAAGVPVSSWFLTVTSFAALAVVVGKRSSERHRSDLDPTLTRAVLSQYPAEFLSQIQAITIGGTLVSYALWAFERSSDIGGTGWFLELSCVPFAIATVRYLLLIQRGEADTPEDALFADRVVVLLGAVWLLCFVTAVWSL